MIPKVKYYGPQIPSTYAVNMTAAASGSSGITVADDNDIDFGTGDFFIHWEGSLPDWTPASLERFWYKYQNSTNRLSFSIRSTGVLTIYLEVAGAVVFEKDATVATGISDASAAKITCVVVRETASSAGSATFYVNGIQIGSSVAIASAAAVTASNSANAIICTNGSSGTGRTASNTISCIVGNFAPTASEVLDLCTNGIPASWKWGSQAALYTSDFSAGSDGWTTAGTMTYTGNQDAIGGLDNWLECRRSSGGVTSMTAQRAISSQVSLLRKITFSIYRPTGAGTAFSYIRVGSAVSGIPAAVVTVPADTVVTVTVAVPITSTSQNLTFVPCNSVGTTVSNLANNTYFYLREITVFGAGATMALLPNSIPTSGATAWDDSSGNTGGGTLPAAGATKVTIRK